MTVAEHIVRFEELVTFSSHYNGAATEGSKCIKFESGMRPKIKQGLIIRRFNYFLC